MSSYSTVIINIILVGNQLESVYTKIKKDLRGSLPLTFQDLPLGAFIPTVQYFFVPIPLVVPYPRDKNAEPKYVPFSLSN